eukprot:TRINITY_DN18588_c0_g1_i1.p1 TRINITY_DN18588_c0_g1~~TRINITY_DN18588_c0_g1_i1.p1  ORF type:complete len:692 (+),score=81.73 TRINITY_DN18588_c0_g1_i1:91-2166(+)
MHQSVICLFFCLSWIALASQKLEISIDAALLDEDSCSSNDGSCSLNLLQRSGSKNAQLTTDLAQVEDAKEELKVSHKINQGAEVSENATSDWQSGRETGKFCLLYHCPNTLGPTQCHHFRCVCAPGSRWSAEKKTCEGSGPGGQVAKTRDTGGSCWMWGCSSWRGPTRCVHHRCLCMETFHAVGGKCVPDSTTSPDTSGTTTTTTEGDPTPPDPVPKLQTSCSLPKAKCSNGNSSEAFACCDNGHLCQLTAEKDSVCSEVTADTVIPKYHFGYSLRKPSKAPLRSFYMYRAQGVTSYPPENVNMASLAGVMWYLHNEIVGRDDWGGTRKFKITRILRYKVKTRAPQTLFESGMNYGARFAFDSGQCTGPFSCDEAFRNYGYYVGCNKMGNFNGFPFPNFPVAYEGVWYSLPGKCPQMKYFDKTKKDGKGTECLMNQPGGFCNGDPTGTFDCTFNFEAAGEIKVDELTGISDYKKFISDGNLEYNRNTDVGIGMTFWNHINDTKLAKWRVKQARDLFNKHYPGTELADTSYADCDFDYGKFYKGPLSTRCVNAPSAKCIEQIKWAKSDGIYAHPDWYPGLTSSSSDHDFQVVMGNTGKTACEVPCASSSPSSSSTPSSSTASSSSELPTPSPPTPARDCGAPSPKCLEQIKWVKSEGIWAHPEWYPGINSRSSYDDIQRFLSKSSSHCKVPC